MISEQTTFQNTPKWRLSDQYFKKKKCMKKWQITDPQAFKTVFQLLSKKQVSKLAFQIFFSNFNLLLC